MKECRIPVFIAYIMVVYSISSFYYLARTYNLGTPFRDSLTTEQLAIKSREAKRRGFIFLQGILIGIFLVVFLQPFYSCK